MSTGLPFLLGFFHGVSGVGRGEWKIRPFITSFSAPIPWTTERPGLREERSIALMESEWDLFICAREKQFPYLKVTERKAMVVWIMAKGREWRNANWKETVGKNVKPLHLCTPLCPSYEVITPNHIHPSWKKKFCQYVVWNHLWVVKAEGFLKCFLYIFFCIFQIFQNKTCILL